MITKIGNRYHNLTEYPKIILEWLITGSTLYLIFLWITYAYFSYAPASYFFEVYSIKPVQSNFDIKEPLLFLSDSQFETNNWVEGEVRLVCPPPRYYSNHLVMLLDYSHPREITSYSYGGAIPEVPSTCHILAIVKVELPYWIKRTQYIESPTFTIGMPHTITSLLENDN